MHTVRTRVLVAAPAASIAALQSNHPVRVPLRMVRAAAIDVGLLALFTAWRRCSVSPAVYANAGIVLTLIELGRCWLPDGLPERSAGAPTWAVRSAGLIARSGSMLATAGPSGG